MKYDYHQYRKKQFEAHPPIQNPDAYSDPMFANQILLDYKRLQEEKEKTKAIAKNEIAMIEKWLAIETERIDKQIEDCRNHLYRYASGIRKKEPNRRTFALPNGRLVFRQKQPSPSYDVPKVVSFLKRENLHQFIKEDLYKNELKKYCEKRNGFLYDPNTGKKVEGVRLKPNGEWLYVYPE